ncbi:MAG: elongation factor P maturation arginine rhamnosyltransferase EarP [Burkholderiales bacterium]|nr:elongation factor P maturation arginine rhamnosyltransferase EarP [Burkholderiales bacterium]
MAVLRWDIFGRVIDNYGDVGVCWRLAAQLAARGDRVRLVLDDLSALAWMAPHGTGDADGIDRIERLSWPGPATPGDVVIEAFGCDPPPAFVAAMRARQEPPVWINLEYLSAEDYVERSHGLPSPQRDGRTLWFFYPGFTARTGGLLREDGLLAERAAFVREPWLAALGAAPRQGERVVSVFCYANDALPALLDDLAAAPTLLLLTQGPAQQQIDDTRLPPTLRTRRLPWLDQRGYDRLLWSSDLNFVRGEDSLVRAIWAGAPFVWQAYPQSDGAHRAKVDALLARLAPPAEAAALTRAWNGYAPWPQWPQRPDTPAWTAWQAATRRWRDALCAQDDLASALRRFVLARRSP